MPSILPSNFVPCGINQPPSGGSNYPFVNPSAEILQLLADFYLSYDDDTGQFVPPFHIEWMYGFGDNAVAAPVGYPTPQHDQELLIVDADGHTVFDSTLGEFASRVWTDRLTVVEWMTDAAVCRASFYTSWGTDQTPEDLRQYYDTHILPVNGELDPRSVNVMPRRVRSLQINGITLDPGQVIFQSGYNVGIVQLTDTVAADNSPLVGEKTLIEGTRRVNQVQFDASPGSGIGVYPGCVTTIPVIKVLGDVEPTVSGHILLQANDCLRSQQPMTLKTSSPRVLTPTPASLKLKNSCAPCCDCSYFVRTYEGLRRQWTTWGETATYAMSVRDTLQANIDRWEAARECRYDRLFFMGSMVEPNCKYQVGATFCNPTNCCINNVTMQFFVTYYRSDNTIIYPCDLLEPLPFLCNQQTKVTGQGARNDVNPDGPVPDNWENFLCPIVPPECDTVCCVEYHAHWAYVMPLERISVVFRVCVPNCGEFDYPARARVYGMALYSTLDQVPSESCVLPFPIGGSAATQTMLLEAQSVANVPTPSEDSAFAVTRTGDIILTDQNAFCFRPTCRCMPTPEPTRNFCLQHDTGFCDRPD